MKTRWKKFLSAAALFAASFIIFDQVQAEEFNFVGKIISPLGGAEEKVEFKLPFDKIADLAALDLGGDGQSEIILTAEAGLKSKLQLYSADGNKLNQWFPYAESFSGATGAVAGDTDNDRLPEIITLPQSGGGPHVRVFDGFGRLKAGNGFFAGDHNYRGMMIVETIRLNAEDADAILVVLKENGRTTIKIFSSAGRLLKQFFPEIGLEEIKAVAALDLGGDGGDEIALASIDAAGANTIRLLRTDGSIINKFNVNPGDLTLAPIKMSGAGELLLVNFAASGEIFIFDGYGRPLKSLKTDKENLAAVIKKGGQDKILVLPRAARAFAETGKKIVIDISEQKISYFQDGFRIASFTVSTGMPGYPTPLGQFKIQNKIPLAYSARYGLYMPYWMAFHRGIFGIHELPYWPSGYKEGEDHLGRPASHGCVRLGVGSAKSLYDWTEVGIPVIVQN